MVWFLIVNRALRKWQSERKCRDHASRNKPVPLDSQLELAEVPDLVDAGGNEHRPEKEAKAKSDRRQHHQMRATASTVTSFRGDGISSPTDVL